MPILTKEVEVKLWGNTVKHYNDLGYKGKQGDVVVVKVEDLPRESHIKIEVLCDFCGKNKMFITYGSYNRRNGHTKGYACRECSYEKMKQTNLERYGVDNYSKTKECHEKMRDTFLARYGVEHNSQLPDYKEKYHKTCLERYGESYKQQFAEKAFESFRDKTGYHIPSQSPEIKEKIKQTWLSKYGVDNPVKSPEVREKMTQTLYANSSQKTSRQQRYICNLYNGILNFPVKHYNVDIYLPDDNLICEYDGGFHMGNVITGRITQEEFNQKEIIRSNIIKREGYKQMRIISQIDKLPQDPTLLQMLSDAKDYFSNYPEHSWIEFNIDTSTLRNAEHKGGIYYDFGELRTIKSVA